MPGVIAMSDSRNKGQLATEMLTHRLQRNEQEKARVHNMGLQKIRILDLILFFLSDLEEIAAFMAVVNGLFIWFVTNTYRTNFFFFFCEMTSSHLCVSELILHLSRCPILSNLGRTDEKNT